MNWLSPPVIFSILGVIDAMALIYNIYLFKIGKIDRKMFISKLFLIGVTAFLIVLFYWSWWYSSIHHSP